MNVYLYSFITLAFKIIRICIWLMAGWRLMALFALTISFSFGSINTQQGSLENSRIEYVHLWFIILCLWVMINTFRRRFSRTEKSRCCSSHRLIKSVRAKVMYTHRRAYRTRRHRQLTDMWAKLIVIPNESLQFQIPGTAHVCCCVWFKKNIYVCIWFSFGSN